MSAPNTVAADPITIAACSISSLLASVDAAPTPWAATAFKAAITRRGRELAETGGAPAMRAVLNRAADSIAHRDVILDAWDGVPGWHLRTVA